MAKSLDEIVLSVLDSTAVDNLIFGDEDCLLAAELFESVQECLSYVSNNQSVDEELPEKDIAEELENTFNILYEQQTSTTGYKVDPVAIAFFKLGQSVGRQQVIRRNISPLRKVIEDRLNRQQQGELAKRKKLGVDYVASVLLDEYIKKNPKDYTENGNRLSHNARSKLKGQLINLFLKGTPNARIVGYSIGETGSASKFTEALKRRENNVAVEYPEDIIKQLELNIS